MRLSLCEIIWEITGACKNSCNYCGSDAVWNQEIDETKIVEIAKAIATYPPKELDISGGDPLLVSLKTHKEILSILKTAGVKCKILFNPKSLREPKNTVCVSANYNGKHTNYRDEKLRILAEYDYIGISVNTEEEIELFIEYYPEIAAIGVPFTIITNFNMCNYHLVDLLVSDVVKDRPWQIQFSVLHHNNAAMYKYPLAVKKLNNDLGKHPNLKIIVADNGNTGKCSAGFASLGVLFDGSVVPCLSMRSWLFADEVNKQSQGNLLTDSLKTIWMTGFTEQRFNPFKCCKDICDHQIICPIKKAKEPELPTGMVYGVNDADTVAPLVTAYYMVATWPQDQPVRQPEMNVMAYAVQQYPIMTTTIMTTTQASAADVEAKANTDEWCYYDSPRVK